MVSPSSYFVAWKSAAINMGVLDAPKAPSNYKDPKAIADYIARESVKQKERAEHLPGVAMLTDVVVADQTGNVVLALKNDRNAWTGVTLPFYTWLIKAYYDRPVDSTDYLVGRHIRTMLRIMSYELMSISVENICLPMLRLLREDNDEQSYLMSSMVVGSTRPNWLFVDPYRVLFPAEVANMVDVDKLAAFILDDGEAGQPPRDEINNLIRLCRLTNILK